MSNFGEILSKFKASEEAENIVAIIDDDELLKGLVAWKSVVVKYKAAGECQEKEEAAQWNWMWDYVEFDISAFGVVAGAKGQDVGGLFRRLKGLRLIYPDGTINKLAKQYLQTTIMSKLRGFQPKVQKAQKEESKQEEVKK